MNKKKLYINIFGIINTFIVLVLYFFILLFLIKKEFIKLNSFNNILIFIAVIFLSLFLILCAININILFANLIYKKKYNKNQLIFISIFGFNLIYIYYFLFIYKNANEKNIINFKSNSYNLIIISILLSIYLTLEIITGLYKIPYFINIPIKYIPLFISINKLYIKESFLFLTLINFICFFLPSNQDFAMPIAYIFDYVIIKYSFLLCYLFPLNIKNKWLNFVSSLFHIFIPILCMLLSRTIAGVLFYSSNFTNNLDAWVWSFSINFVNSSIHFLWFIIFLPAIIKKMNHII